MSVETSIEFFHSEEFLQYIDRFFPKNTVRETVLPRLGKEVSVTTFANEVWLALPDSPSIHGPVFYRLCDIAEEILYNEGY